MTTHMENENENENENKIEEANATEIWPTFADFWDLYDKKIDSANAKQSGKKLDQRPHGHNGPLELYVLPRTNKAQDLEDTH